MTPADPNPSTTTTGPRSTATILARAARHDAALWQPDVVFVRGEGCWLWDADGNRYLDCMAGIAVASVGHANPRLASAIARQAEKLIVCPQNLGNDVRTDLTDALFQRIPAPLERVFFGNSGTEANEAALKWARVATGRRRFVAAKRGFSGRTLGSLGLTWEAKYREPFGPLPYEADFVRYDDPDELRAAVTHETAAVVLEPVQGEGGVHPASRAYLEAAREITREKGALLIFDEIQTGAGRTGRFLACEHADVIPDMVTLAKGLGGGVPIGALVMTDGVAKAMPSGGHGTTFGGNPLAAAAALAVLQEIDERDLLRNAAEMGAYFRDGLAELPRDRVRDVRGIGLLIGVELKEKAAPVISAMRERGVLCINAGATVVRFVPPLTIARDEVDVALDALAEALDATA